MKSALRILLLSNFRLSSINATGVRKCNKCTHVCLHCTSGVRGATRWYLWLSPVCDCPNVCGYPSAPLSWISGYVSPWLMARVRNLVRYRDTDCHSIWISSWATTWSQVCCSH